MERRPAPAARSAPSRAAPAARPAVRTAPAARTAPASRTAASSGYRGDAGARKVAEEDARAKQRAEQRKNQIREPFRALVPVGEQREFVVLDDRPDFYRFEHNYKNAQGEWKLHSGCVKDHDDCPACRALGKESTFCMYLSVIDLAGFTTKDGENVPFSRQLFVVKGPQQKKILRMTEREGSLRGLILLCTRDGDKEPRIGNDIEVVGRMEEADLETYVREWTDREGKTHIENCFEVFDYEALFPPVTSDELRALFGGAPTPGSRAANSAVHSGARATTRAAPRREDRDGWEDPEAEGTYEEGAEGDAPPPARPAARAPARPASRTRTAPPAEEVYDEPEGEPEAAPAPRRTAAPARPAPARPVTRTRAAPPPAEEVYEEGGPEGDPGAEEVYEEDPAPPSRPAARPAPRTAPARPVSRAAAPAAPTRRVSFRPR